MLRPVLLCFIALLAALAAGCWEGTSRHVLATVLGVRGEVTARPNERTDFQPVNADSVFGGGTLIRALPGANLDLILVPGLLLRLFENSELRIEELTLVKDGNETVGGMRSRTGRIKLNRGRIVAYFMDADGAQGQVIIETDRVKFTAGPASLAQIQTDQNTTRAVSVLGTVYTWPADSINPGVQKGFFQVWPSVHPALPAADDSQGQTELAETAQTGEQLRDLREQNLPRRNRFPR